MLTISNTDNRFDLKEVTSDKAIVNNLLNPEGLFSQEIFGDETIPSCRCGALVGAYLIGEECPAPACNSKVSNEYGRSGALIRIPNNLKIINPSVLNFIHQQGLNLITLMNPQNKIVTLEGDFEYKEGEYYNISDVTNNPRNFVESVIWGDDQFKEFLLDLVEKDLFTMNSIYVIPLSLREAQLGRSDNKTSISMREINGYYMQILSHMQNIRNFEDELYDADVLENELYQTQVIMAEMADYIIRDVFSGKDGLFRDSLLSNRINFSGRAPITLLSPIYRYDEIHIPRDMFVEIYKLKLANQISQLMGIGIYEAERYMYQNRFNENDEVINQAIDNLTTGEELAVLLNRNPSLRHNNMIYLRVTQVHSASTLLISRMLLPSLAGDIDGDTAAIFTLDTIEAKEAAKRLYSLESLVKSPYHNGKFATNFLGLSQDNRLGVWLMNDENRKHIQNNK